MAKKKSKKTEATVVPEEDTALLPTITPSVEDAQEAHAPSETVPEPNVVPAIANEIAIAATAAKIVAEESVKAEDAPNVAEESVKADESVKAEDPVKVAEDPVNAEEAPKATEDAPKAAPTFFQRIAKWFRF